MTRQEAARRVSGGFSALLHWITRAPVRSRLKARDREDEKALTKGEPMLVVYQERQLDLIAFYNHYESLVEILCDAAQAGSNPTRESSYQEQKKWMQTHYYLIRPYALAYLRLESEDAEQGIALQGYPTDAFQALFAADNLEAFVHADDGNMISRIVRTRDALSHYGEQLRQLITREKACL